MRSDRDRYDDHDEPVDISRRGGSSGGGDGDLSTGDWLLCIFCSGIACIIAIVRLIQGKPGAGKMLAVSLVFVVIWNIVRFALQASMQR